LRSCLHDYEKSTKDFEGYRAWIREQRIEFSREVGTIWGGEPREKAPLYRVKARNYFIFYRDKIRKKLSGYKYPPDDGN
jgi:hypothetical protein